PNRAQQPDFSNFVGRTVGRYHICGVLGGGSFGIVYLAHDPQLVRDCALKIPRIEVLVDEDKRRRFGTEATAAAALAHPAIVPVYEAEIDGPMPYIATAICNGPNLADWLQDHQAPVPERQAARFMAQLADAVHYAHQRGVFHRDLKPSNVLLEPRETCNESGDELDDYVPRLTDFGLAKLVESDTSTTRASMLLGTPVYVAPELLAGDDNVKDQRLVDVYGLGCLLYELLSGGAPFARDSVAETLLAVREHEPVLRRRRADVSTNLEAICHKAIEKRPQRRYASARQLADDLERFLDGREVAARPITSWERGLRWCRRNPLPAVSLLVTCVAVVGVTLTTIWHNARLSEALVTSNRLHEEALSAGAAANEARRSLQRELYAHEMKLAFDARDKHWNEEVDRILGLFDDPADDDVRTYPWYLLQALSARTAPIVMRGHEGAVREVAVHPDGERLVSVGDDGTIRTWNIDDGRLLATIAVSAKPLNALAVSPDGEYVVTGNQGLALWRLDTGERVRPLTWHSTTIEEAAFSPDGRQVASAARSWHIHLINLDTGETKKFQTDSGNESLTFVDGGRALAGVGQVGKRRVLRIWDTSTGELTLDNCIAPDLRFKSFDLTRDGRYVAIGGGRTNEPVRVYDTETWQLVGATERVRGVPEDIFFSPDGLTLVMAGDDGLLMRWPLASQPSESAGNLIAGQLAVIPAHEGRITSGVFVGPAQIATAGEDGFVKVWKLDDNTRFVRRLPERMCRVARLPGQHAIATITKSGLLKIVDDDGKETELARAVAPMAALVSQAHGGVFLSVVGPDRTVEVWDVEARTRRGRFMLDHDVKHADVSSNGRWLAATGVDGYTAVWDLETQQRLLNLKLDTWGTCVAFSPHNELLAVGGRVDDTLLIDTSTWHVVHRLHGVSDTYTLAFSTDGRCLATGHIDAAIRLWNVENGQMVAQMKGHRGGIARLVFDPANETLFSASGADSVRCWDLRTHRGLGVVWPLVAHGLVWQFAFDEPGGTMTMIIEDAITDQCSVLEVETNWPARRKADVEN
ncbi:MAG: protein kinase, partial [Planctomycetales bacterium]|nr:protein kinase [Planctomycetales bacterium]